jgi:hypothetical protein
MGVLKIKNRPQFSEAIAFTGGRKNAEEILAWLNQNDYEGVWIGPQPTLGKDEYPSSREERLDFDSTLGTFRPSRANVGDWLVLVPSDAKRPARILAFDASLFIDRYQIVEDE